MIHISSIAAILFMLALSCAVLANMLMPIVIGKVNRRLPDQEQISYFGWSIERVNHSYKQFQPHGKSAIAAYVLGIPGRDSANASISMCTDFLVGTRDRTSQ
jgi:hypothetical protein